jgi:hypothetical protein
MSARIPFLALGASLALIVPAAPAAGGVWFDIGGGMPVTIYANGSIQTHETYAPFAFGPFPAGSLVFQDISIVPAEALGQPELISGETRFVRGFRCTFSGVSCGCQGALVVPSQLRFAYDPMVVMATGAVETELRLLFRDDVNNPNWTLMPGAVLDAEGDGFTATWSGNVLGVREFAILTQDITPVAAGTWGRLKALYRR